MEVLDLEEMLETADVEADEVAKLFDLEHVTLVHLFLKREAGRDRQLQQIGDSMFLRTMYLMSPVLKTWFLDEEFIIGESGSRTFEEVAERLFNFQDKGNGGSNVCTDHFLGLRSLIIAHPMCRFSVKEEMQSERCLGLQCILIGKKPGSSACKECKTKSL